MRERRGAIGRARELADSLVAGVKRRQAARAPQVMLYDEDGRPRTLEPGSEPAQALVATARSLVDLAGPDDLAADVAPEDE